MSAGSEGAKEFEAVLTEHLGKLRGACGLFQRDLKGAIAEAEAKVKGGSREDTQVDLRTALKPFVQAMEQPKSFELVVIRAFCELFEACTPSRFLVAATTDLIVEVVFEKTTYSDENVCKAAAMFAQACLSSASGRMFCRGRSLKRVLVVLFRSYDMCRSAEIQKEIKSICFNLIKRFFDEYEEPDFVPEMRSVQELSAHVTKQLVSSAVVVHLALDYVLAAGDYSPSLKDVDLCIVFRTFCDVNQTSEFSVTGKELATSCMIEFLSMNSEFFVTNAFEGLLKHDICSMMTYIILKGRHIHTALISKLILILWHKFQSLNPDVMKITIAKSLMSALMSSKTGIIQRGLSICSHLAERTQLWVDIYVNCDCDPMGACDKIFEKCVTAILRLGTEHENLSLFRPTALKTVVDLLSGMWKYFCRAGREALAHETATTSEPSIELPDKEDSEVAKVLFENVIDRKFVGKYIVEHEGVLAKFFELFSFEGMSFLESFRLLLSKCCVYDEVGCVDRVLENFSKRYCECHPNDGFSLEAIYVLSFSTLVLNFSLQHGDRGKLTFQEFCEYNSAEVSGESFSLKYLQEIYDGITANPVPCGSIDDILRSCFLTRDKRADLFLTQCNSAIEKASKIERDPGQFIRVVSPYFIRPMFLIMADGTLNLIGSAYRDATLTDSRELVDQCLTGFRSGVCIAAHAFIDTSLTSFMSTCSAITGAKAAPHADQRTVLCLDCMSNVWADNSNVLSNFWDVILEPASAADKLGALLSAKKSSIDTVFERSAEFHPQTILEFVKAVCRLSLAEINENPARFSLAKRLITIIDCNLHRSHAVLMRIWKEISGYLCSLASSLQKKTMEFGIDLMKQLILQVLPKDTSSIFHFEKNFMMTFIAAFQDLSLPESQTNLLQTLSLLINEAGSRIQSGWSVILQILSIATIDPSTSKLAFNLMTTVITHHLQNLGDAIEGLIDLIPVFAKNSQMIEAPKCFETVADSLDPASRHWTALFSSIARSCESRSSDVCRETQNAMINVIKKAILKGVVGDTWKYLFIDLLPKMYVTSSAQFFSKLIHDAIVPNSENISSYVEFIIEAIGRAILSKDEELATKGIEISTELIENRPFKESTKAYLDMIEMVSRQSMQMSLSTATAFIGTIERYSECLGDSQICPRVAKVIETSLKEHNKTDSEKRNVICAASRSLLNSWIRTQAQSAEEISIHIGTTVSMFLDSGYLQSEQSQGAQAWKEAICGALQIVNGLDVDQFGDVFARISGLLIQLILASSLDIRSEVGITLERKLVL